MKRKVMCIDKKVTAEKTFIKLLNENAEAFVYLTIFSDRPTMNTYWEVIII